MILAARQLASISDEKLQELRDRVDLVAVVQRRVPLKKSGRDWKGLCPFHGEKTSSFYVVPDKKMFHCFGCGVSGDAIKFVMQMEGRSFRDAVEQLAGEAGVDLTPPDPEEARRSARRAALGEVNEKACTFYERVLWEHPKGEVAREHLRKRGITEDTAKAWRLGYAPNLWDSLMKSHALKGVDPALVEEAGLGVPRKKGPGLYDRFRGRLLIPIRESGRIVGFGGRLLEGQSEAKYLNSPDTPLYQKGQSLFALDRAREAIRREEVAVFVEGYFDAIGLHQAGVLTAIATCGTALTEKHLELVKKAGAKELVFVFDGDAAGLRAAQRASEIAAAQAVAARVLVPPGGEDPDETVLRVGIQGFRDLLAAAQPSLEFLLDRALGRLPKGAPVESRVRAVDAVRGIVQAAPSSLARDLYVEKVAEMVGAPPDSIRRALAGKAPLSPTKAAPARAAESAKPLPLSVLKAELVILAALVRNPTLAPELAHSGGVGDFVHPSLREAADAVCSGHDAQTAIRAVEPDSLRQRVLDALAEMEQAGDHTDAKRLSSLLKKHAQTVALERKQRASPRVPRA
ncbi:MAG: DNA primase [Deltaproteobacteria bacterium]|nr:MAG: DNA primase [Deltaproteobacteria bacterium]